MVASRQRGVAAIGLFALGALVAGCNSASGTREPDEYTGCATDEHWRTFDDQEPHATVDDTLAPAFTAPAAGAVVPLATKPTVTWTQDANDPGMPTGDVPYMDGPGCTMCCPQFNTGAIMTQHLPAISGDVYDLQFRVGGSVVYRVITTLQEWMPPDATWASWKGKTIALQIWRLDVLHNDVKQGPFTPSTPLTFVVASG